MAAKIDKKIREEVDMGVKKHQEQVIVQLKNLENKIDRSEKENYNHILEKAKSQAISKTSFIHTKFREHTSTAMIAAFSFLIAIAWKDLIVKVVNEYVKPSLLESHPYISELITAFVVTIVAILGITIVSKWAKKPETK